ncbi:MAG TPA: orotate phosphoribosyltransferase [Candidatus Hydrogenedentes bacterium]|nr:orotate phosphoribosyltransferase [Candidatus Hydrogenedentota bacterium]
MTSGQVLDIFRATGALLEGHFLYTSGRHGAHFVQASRVLQFPNYTERLCKAIAEKWSGENIELVVGPATGGIILSYETARHLECRSVFTEKDDDGGMSMKRGFKLEPGTNVLVVEDIVTTGGSVKKTIEHLRGRGARIAGVSVLVDRSGGEANFDCPYKPLAYLALRSYAPSECPGCQDNIPLSDPDDLIV